MAIQVTRSYVGHITNQQRVRSEVIWMRLGTLPRNSGMSHDGLLIVCGTQLAKYPMLVHSKPT
ncbi:MAG: hypothetical protein J07HQW2_03836 [Haloquadratum walsbyi J07HQW2]|uniref:Uncharacterized protein n=1 Tax=Haloquadratum walsbyi J07HQW2 TaxID=1238425 RepID=U1NJE8_9EURY|nr:MAG: hypothetical protein J07HQW2_03836 [Haloquadratum walsbyi J07HQW2]